MGRKHYLADFGDDLGAFGEGLGQDLAGPLVGGGATQVGILASKLLFKGKPAAKYAAAIGTVLGAGVSAALMFSPRFRRVGVQSLATALLVGIPRQIEDMLTGPGATNGYLGLITPEREMAGYDDGMGYFGADQMAQDVQLLDSGSGSSGLSLGVITPEREMAGPEGVELLGGGQGGFGANFLS